MAFLRAASMGVYGRVTDLSGRPLTKTRIVLDGRGEIRVNDKDARQAIFSVVADAYFGQDFGQV